MNTLQLVQHGFFWGLIFGGLFCVATLILGRINAEMLLSDYPPDIRARFGPMRPETRKKANIASLPLLAILLAVIVVALAQLRQFTGELTFINTLIVATLIFQIWNLIDLLVLDWLILMTLRPRFMILPGTEGLAGYQDYRFHFQKFIKGIALTLVLGFIVTGIALGVEALV
jgi:hypothetical protein